MGFKLFYLILCLVFIPIVIAETSSVNLGRGESFLIGNKNVTLVSLDGKDDVFILCVNNKKAIVREDMDANGVDVDVKGITNNYVSLDLTYKCKSCNCTEECLNLECFPKLANITEKESISVINEEVKEEVNDKEVEEENLDVSIIPVLVGIGILLVFLIIILFGVYKVKSKEI